MGTGPAVFSDQKTEADASARHLDLARNRLKALQRRQKDPAMVKELEKVRRLFSLLQQAAAKKGSLDRPPPVAPEREKAAADPVPENGETTLVPAEDPRAPDDRIRSWTYAIPAEGPGKGLTPLVDLSGDSRSLPRSSQMASVEKQPASVRRPADSSGPEELAARELIRLMQAMKSGPPSEAWTGSLTLRAGGGYATNVLRSSLSEIDAGAFYASADALWANTDQSVQRWLALGRLTNASFPGRDEVEDERVAFGALRYERRFGGSDWWWGFSGDLLKARQPIDDPDEFGLGGGSLPVEYSQYGGGLSVIRDAGGGHRMALQITVRNEDIERVRDLEDQRNRQKLVSLDYRWRPESDGHGFNVRLEMGERNYDGRRQRNPDGRYVDGTRSRVHWWAARLEHQYQWKAAGYRWEFGQGLRLRQEEGNGGGYEDWIRLGWSSRVRMEGRLGSLSAEMLLGRVFYDSRRVSGTDSRRREREFFSLGLEAERALSKNWSLWGRLEDRRNTGNSAVDRYRNQSIYAGVQREF
ncbi:MAG: hypothetical protein AAF514_10945 [Verrucomicrobiota bacterium]